MRGPANNSFFDCFAIDGILDNSSGMLVNSLIRLLESEGISDLNEEKVYYMMKCINAHDGMKFDLPLYEKLAICAL